MIAALALVLASLSSSAAAAVAAGTYDLGARVAYYVPADSDGGTWNPGALARYHFNDRLAAEGAFFYQRHSFPATTAHAAVVQASGMLYAGEGRLRGYGAAGLGFFATRVEGPQYRRNLGRFAPHAGAGAEFAVTPEWIVEVDYRHVWLGDLETRNPVTGAPAEFKNSGEQVSFGVSRRF